MLLLTTTGAKSGRRAWYHNLVANPDATVEVGTETVDVRADVLTGDERDRLYRRQAEQVGAFAEYEQKTTRTIPVVALTRTG